MSKKCMTAEEKKTVKETRIIGYVTALLILGSVIWGLINLSTILDRIILTGVGLVFLFTLWLSYKVAKREIKEKG